MTEDISPIYEQVSIEDWADRIHEIKIRELTELLKLKLKEYEPYAGAGGVNSFKDANKALKALSVGIDMLKLTTRRRIVQKHGRK